MTAGLPWRTGECWRPPWRGVWPDCIEERGQWVSSISYIVSLESLSFCDFPWKWRLCCIPCAVRASRRGRMQRIRNSTTVQGGLNEATISVSDHVLSPYNMPVNICAFRAWESLILHFSRWGTCKNTESGHHLINLSFVNKLVHKRKTINSLGDVVAQAAASPLKPRGPPPLRNGLHIDRRGLC